MLVTSLLQDQSGSLSCLHLFNWQESSLLDLAQLTTHTDNCCNKISPSNHELLYDSDTRHRCITVYLGFAIESVQSHLLLVLKITVIKTSQVLKKIIHETSYQNIGTIELIHFA